MFCLFLKSWPFLEIVRCVFRQVSSFTQTSKLLFYFTKTAKIPALPLSLSHWSCDPEEEEEEEADTEHVLNFLFNYILFLLQSSAVNRTSCDSVLILSCICGVTLLSVKIFGQVPRPGLCDAYHNVYKTGSDFCWWDEHQKRENYDYYASDYYYYYGDLLSLLLYHCDHDYSHNHLRVYYFAMYFLFWDFYFRFLFIIKGKMN